MTGTITRDELALLPVDEALQQLVDDLVASFDEQTGRWHPCWQNVGLFPHNATTGVSYRGINTLLLWAAQVKRRYDSPRWATYVQWSKIGAQVQRGAKGVRCVKWVELAKRDPDDDSRAKIVPKVFTVFNPAQVEGAPVDESEGLPDGDWFLMWQVFSDSLPDRPIQGEPCYVPDADVVQLPKMCLFDSIEEYCRSFAHEFAHWTKPRLKREMPANFDMDPYAFEELVAEISASMTCAWLQVPESQIIHENHVVYIRNWLGAMRENPRVLLTAAQMAQRATDYLLDFHREDKKCPVHAD